MKYDAVIEPTREGWGGTVSGLPILGVGDTVEETLQDLAAAAAFYVELMTEDNQPIPPPAPYETPLEPGGRILPQAITVEIPALAP